MEFDASLTDFIVYHEQFIGKDNRQLRLLSAQLDKHSNDQQDQKLVSVHFVHTSAENPLFKSNIYDGIENRAYVHFSKLVVILQLEALLSILRFQDALLKKLPKDLPMEEMKKKDDETKKVQNLLKPVEDDRRLSRSISTTGRVGRKNGGISMVFSASL